VGFNQIRIFSLCWYFSHYSNQLNNTHQKPFPRRKLAIQTFLPQTSLLRMALGLEWRSADPTPGIYSTSAKHFPEGAFCEATSAPAAGNRASRWAR
jgi:hypothetical protein